MIEKVNHCPVCQNKTFENHIICKDHMVSNESFTIVKCTRCNFLFTNPRPNLSKISDYYKSDQYISHTDKSNNLINKIYKIARLLTLRQKESLVASISEEKSILDFGCGTGDFLNTCRNKNWNIHGYEPDHDANNIAQNKNDIEIFKELNQLNDIKDLSIITLWHVLEHVLDINETIDKLQSTLSKKGKILIAVPNHKSYDALHYKNYWAAYDVPRHLYHFSQETIHKLLKKHGLKIVQVKPMKLDSFYVSLLSEKYKNGNQNMIKSFINGYKSNIYAKKNNNNYSSLIYIASK